MRVISLLLSFLFMIVFPFRISAEGLSISTLPDQGPVTLTAVVAEVRDYDEFTLRDATGSIDVGMEGGKSVDIKAGQTVIVEGTMDTGSSEKAIAATHVKIVLSSSTEAAAAKTPVLRISELPEEGQVRVSGVVSQQFNRHSFLLQDATGEMMVESTDAAPVVRNIQVTVTGYMSNAPGGRSIKASDIQVESESPRVEIP